MTNTPNTLAQLNLILDNITPATQWCDECSEELGEGHIVHGEHLFCSERCALDHAYHFDGLEFWADEEDEEDEEIEMEAEYVDEE